MPDRKKLGVILVNVCIILIIVGFLMIIQPFTLSLYTMGFSVILSGVILFNIVSHF